MFCFSGLEAREILEPAPPALEGEVLTTGPPRKSSQRGFHHPFVLFARYVFLIYDIVSFLCTAKWISCVCTHVRSVLDSFRLQILREYRALIPGLHLRSWLVICFLYRVCICQPQSPNLSLPFPTLPPPHNYAFVFSICSSFCLVGKFICTLFFLDST